MLTELHIENLGVIEKASLRFGAGLTALTGETGAGKTMLVEAIELLVGGRADSGVVRHGAVEARIDGRIVVSQNGEQTEMVLTRVVPADGRSRAYVDDRPVTVSRLADLTANLIDLHGQHAHQSLLSPATQRQALDRFAGIDLEPLRAARHRVTEVEAELATLGGDERARARELDLLRFQVAELDAANIQNPDEDAALAQEESTLADAVAHRAAGVTAVDALRNDEADPLGAAIRALDGREPYREMASRLENVAAELDDIVADLRATAERIDENPQRLTEIRERRQLLADMRRKYGDDLAAVLEFHRETTERLGELESYDERAAALDAERVAALQMVASAAATVAAARQAAAPDLAQQVESHLSELAMPNARVGVAVEVTDTDLAGDGVSFLLAANPGSALQPLNRVASGGELARAMLALRLVLSSPRFVEGAGTLVFDEVDAGIGGSAAVAVGAALACLGAEHQVLVVTHLPQVAAHAAEQLVVDKHTDSQTTSTVVRPVAGDERVAEVARMLSGSLSDASLGHARDLLADR